MNIAERLKAVVGYSSLSVRAFAIKCGMTQSTLDRQIKQERNVNIDTLTKILTTFPEVSAEWLLLGNGLMLKTDNYSEEEMRNIERLKKMTDVIGTLQEAIKTKDDTISILTNRIKELEQLKTK